MTTKLINLISKQPLKSVHKITSYLQLHRRRKMFYGGGAKHIFWLSQLHDQPKSHVRSLYTYYVVQSTIKLGGSGGMPPRKILKNSMLGDGFW